MKTYDPNEKCPKCGCENIEDRYILGTDDDKAVVFCSNGRIYAEYEDTEEFTDFIGRACTRCGFKWLRLPLITEAQEYEQQGG